MRPALGVLLICALTPLAAGCGAGDDVKSAVDPVAQAATNTQNAGSVAIAMSGGASAAGQEIPLQGEGVFDLKGKRGRFTMTTSVPGQQASRSRRSSTVSCSTCTATRWPRACPPARRG